MRYRIWEYGPEGKTRFFVQVSNLTEEEEEFVYKGNKNLAWFNKKGITFDGYKTIEDALKEVNRLKANDLENSKLERISIYHEVPN